MAELDEATRADYKEAFSLFDKNGDGTLQVARALTCMARPFGAKSGAIRKLMNTIS